MSEKPDIQQLLTLPAEERLALAEALMESVMESEDLLTMTDAQKRAVSEAVAAYRADPNSAVPWEEVRARLLGQ